MIIHDNFEKELLLKTMDPNGKRILEIGCGFSLQYTYLSKLAKQYIAIDINQKAIEDNQFKNKLSNVTFEYGNAEQLGYADEDFDIVFLLLCFHEISLQETALSEFFRVLKKNGKLIIIDPSYPSGQFQQLFDQNQLNFTPFDHVKFVLNASHKLENSKLFSILHKENYTVKYVFKDFHELIEFLILDSIELTTIYLLEERKNIIKTYTKEFLKKNQITIKKEIELLDELTLYVLGKNK